MKNQRIGILQLNNYPAISYEYFKRSEREEGKGINRAHVGTFVSIVI